LKTKLYRAFSNIHGTFPPKFTRITRTDSTDLAVFSGTSVYE